MILIFCARKFPVHEWYASLNEKLILFTSDEIVDYFPEEMYAHVETFSDFWNNPMVAKRAIQLSKMFSINKIVGPMELDMIRVAKLREHLQISGSQSAESAQQYRDKVWMKEKVKSGGLRVPNFRRLQDEVDLLTFIEENGYPVLIKPLLAFGSIGVEVFRDEEDLDRFLNQKPQLLGYEIEEYIDGTLYTVDGVIQDGEVAFISTSEYVGGNLIDLDSSGINGNWILHPSNPLAQRLMSYTKKMLQVLETPQNTVFHAELFHTHQDDDIVLCEIASRTPGSHLPNIIEQTYGLDLVKSTFLTQLDIPVDLPARGCENPEQLYAFVYFTPKEGQIAALPTETPPEWVVEYELLGEVGQVFPKGVNYDYPYAYIIFAGNTESELQERTTQICKWFTDRVVWETNFPLKV
jgi:hypothetical protein